MEKHRILVIDDDPIVVRIVQVLFDDKLCVTCAGDGEEGLRAVAEQGPDIVLLDIQMDGMDGYETCRRMRLLELENQPYVIFVSADGDPVRRLAAYNAGGEDFVGKPLQAEELTRKVEQALRVRNEINELRKQTQGAMSVAMSAMTDSSALGACLHYFRRLFSVSGPEALMEASLEAVGEFGLNGAVQLRVGGEARTLNSERCSNPMESLLLEDLSADRRHIVSSGSRTAFHYGPVSILINNMPVDDPDRYGKLKDYLALMAEGAAERLHSLALDSRDAVAQRHRHEVRALFGAMCEELERSLTPLGLSGAQRQALAETLDKTARAVDALCDGDPALAEGMDAPGKPPTAGITAVRRGSG
ncbi:response regulator [Chromobacterium sp. CV08]|uniref:response regulator n=1 Tax=Chromobacterium sp. CV08 TaxID=3133274 RepID=UPI003DA8B6A8